MSDLFRRNMTSWQETWNDTRGCARDGDSSATNKCNQQMQPTNATIIRRQKEVAIYLRMRDDDSSSSHTTHSNLNEQSFVFSDWWHPLSCIPSFLGPLSWVNLLNFTCSDRNFFPTTWVTRESFVRISQCCVRMLYTCFCPFVVLLNKKKLCKDQQ